jgi:vanillate O-demethylase ferredoxin subunit
MRYRIDAIIPHGPAVKEFRLAPLDGNLLAPWRPGAHVELSLRARAGAGFTNAYSIVGEADGMLRIAVQREQRGRGGSRVLHDEYEPGMVLELGPPLDGFRMHAGAVRTVLIAGGIGITPIIPMAHSLHAAGLPYELHYLVRNPERLVLPDDVLRLDQRRVHCYFTGSEGRPDLERLIGAWEQGCELHACGPHVLLGAIRAGAMAQGWPAQHIRFESFGARVHDDDLPLRVHLLQTGLTLDVFPGKSILEALIEADVLVSYECKRGECGSCYASVVSGEADHRDVCLSPRQRALGMTPCVSWARSSELVLDL